MTALASPIRLDRLNDLGLRWASLVRAAGPCLHPDSDPWILHPVNLRTGHLPQTLPTGPAIYGAIGNGAWQYAGRTIQPVRGRVYGHAHDRDAGRRDSKAATWHYLAALVLADGTDPAELGRLERAAKTLLNPRGGSRWSRG